MKRRLIRDLAPALELTMAVPVMLAMDESEYDGGDGGVGNDGDGDDGTQKMNYPIYNLILLLVLVKWGHD